MTLFSMNLVNHKMFNCVGVQKPLVEYALVELFCSIVAVQYILVQASWKGEKEEPSFLFCSDD